ncbi:anhydro-N-acetylmuramic acid kinase [Ornithinibacillus salinisoli]|uniref:Anhydro-N-acetylmuramic acid kinase n=1 Tax=Ornithinibacillus salinisoli TaxID=1848459 RepID=A0ABW4W0P9_9BACI
MSRHEESHYIVGLMSGTSLDGIDVSVIEIKEQEPSIDIKPIHFKTYSYTENVKEMILALCDPIHARIEEISAMNMYLGELFAEAARSAIQEAGLEESDILLISSHGQTIFHQPEPITIDGNQVTSTFQIGDIGVIAERTGIKTVGDFRTRDMAAGGQGAPLVPYVDYMFFRKKEYGSALLNIGGISNMTILPRNCSESEAIAYDTGPGNMIIDAFTGWATGGKQSFDKDGELAAKGKVHERWLSELLDHSYFHMPAPKSTGRESFGIEFAKKAWLQAEEYQINNVDRIATVTALTAKTIALEISKFTSSAHLQEVLVSGGGRFNNTLMYLIATYLPSQLIIKGTDEYGMPAEAKEAISFAILGYQCYKQRTNNLPSATGAQKNVVMGKIAW